MQKENSTVRCLGLQFGHGSLFLATCLGVLWLLGFGLGIRVGARQGWKLATGYASLGFTGALLRD